MTEAEWLGCTDPWPMLEFLPVLEFLRGKATDRKLRLFTVACSRHLDQWMVDVRSKQAVEVCELYADGLVDTKQLRAAKYLAFSATKTLLPDGLPGGAALYCSVASDVAIVALVACAGDPRKWSQETAIFVCGLASSCAYRVIGNGGGASERQYQCGVLRDIFGPLPFRPVAVDPGWLRWNSAIVPAIARRVYDERRFEDMPILADALEDAGCTNADILTHCRSDLPHVRGCWVLDLILGKQ